MAIKQIKTMKSFFIDAVNRDAWLEMRTKGIGASEVGTILGVNPFETPRDLWLRKTGKTAPVEENEAMLMGHLLEDAVAQRWAIETGNQIIKRSAADRLYIAEGKDYLRCSPDRTYYGPGEKHNQANLKVLECKTTFKDIDPDDVPKSWFCQVQWNLHIIGAKSGSLAWLTMGRKFGFLDIQYDPEFAEYLEQKVTDFWAINVIGGKEPDPVNVGDVLKKFSRQDDGKKVTATAEILQAWNDLKTAKEMVAKYTDEKAAAEDKIKMFMMDAEALVDETGKTLNTWKAGKDKTTFDAKRFQAENPDLYASYCVTVPGSRTFLTK